MLIVLGKVGISPEHEEDIVRFHYIPRRVVSALDGDPELGRDGFSHSLGCVKVNDLGVELSSFTYLESRKKDVLS